MAEGKMVLTNCWAFLEENPDATRKRLEKNAERIIFQQDNAPENRETLWQSLSLPFSIQSDSLSNFPPRNGQNDP